MDDILADNRVTELNPHTSHEYDFDSPSPPISPNRQTSPFDEPLTFYSYASSSQTLPINPQSLLERLQLKSTSLFPLDRLQLLHGQHPPKDRRLELFDSSNKSLSLPNKSYDPRSIKLLLKTPIVRENPYAPERPCLSPLEAWTPYQPIPLYHSCLSALPCP